MKRQLCHGHASGLRRRARHSYRPSRLSLLRQHRRPPRHKCSGCRRLSFPGLWNVGYVLFSHCVCVIASCTWSSLQILLFRYIIPSPTFQRIPWISLVLCWLRYWRTPMVPMDPYFISPLGTLVLFIDYFFPYYLLSLIICSSLSHHRLTSCDAQMEKNGV